MTDCSEFRPMIAALLDAELSFGNTARVEEHLKGCKDCANAFAEISALRNSAGQDELSPVLDIWARVSEEISAASEDDVAAEIRLLRQEMKALREEIFGLRRELAQSKTPQLPRGIVLNLPDVPTRSLSRYRLV